MGKNVIILSDGTGQAGGFRFDEDRSNVYKLYRATRCGPDSSVDPREQVAFYDAGLGSQADGWSVWRWVHNLVSKATGFGITANIVDCYAALIRLWRPGDRIFLFGFSRGAYTVRCLGGVIAQCGIPTRGKDGKPLKLDIASTRNLAQYAVKHVYQFTSSRKYADAGPRQKFLLDTRALLAKRFRADYGSGDDDRANVYPYFIGVFDTVASLGSLRKATMLGLLYLAFAAALGGFVHLALRALDIDPRVVFGVLAIPGTVLAVILIAGASALALALCVYVYTHLKFDFAVPGYDFHQSLRTVHLTELWAQFHDWTLHENVGYAKHAISIDERRKDFERVRWGHKDSKRAPRDPLGNVWFEQVWFAGNHSDIGGSYPEIDSRLSDIALKWMVDCATAIPDGLKYDANVLRLFPHPEGVQHDEVKVGYGLLTRLFGLNWSKAPRELPVPDATMHPSVYDRFDLDSVQLYDDVGPYRPETLRTHIDFAVFYQEGCPFPATSKCTATALAASPGGDKNRTPT